MRPDLTLSIINHANPHLLQACLRSLFAATHTLRLDVWVVDNATDRAGVREIQAEFPQVHWLFNTERLGFSANHNQVLKQAAGRYACILNDDTIVHDGALDTLIAYLDTHPQIGLAGAKLLHADGTLQNCTFRFPTLLSEVIDICFLPGPLNRLKTIGLDPAQNHSEPVRVDWVLGACLVVRDTALGQVGLLDSKLSPIAYTEEIDWCYRAHKLGWEVAYCPAAILTHYGGQSTIAAEIGPDRMRVEYYRTRLRFFRKHYGPLSTLLLRLIYLATFPWNAAMLAQSALRRTITFQMGRNRMATLYEIAGVSLQ
jgi:N-acetylglucosaminyl-diphospho-decaprenol L-rhamnosyltransferase